MKLLALAVLVFGAILCTYGLTNNSVQTWGARNYDSRIYYMLVNKTAATFKRFGVTSRDIKFPPKVDYF